MTISPNVTKPPRSSVAPLRTHITTRIDGRADHQPAEVSLRGLDTRDLLAADPLQLFRHPLDVDRLAALLLLDLLLQIGLPVGLCRVNCRVPSSAMPQAI